MRLLVLVSFPLVAFAEGGERESNGGGGGWGSSGGGSGVACFKDEATARRADKYIAQTKPLPDFIKNEIRELQTLDYWEWTHHKKYNLFQPKSANYKDIIAEAYYRMSFVIPLLVYRLSQAGELVEPEKWTAQTVVPRIFDAKPKAQLPARCRLVQLAVRYASDKIQLGDGPSKKVPKVKVIVDKDLMSRMDPMNQAILVVHEQFYLLGQRIGHKSSNPIRQLVTFFFNEESGPKTFMSLNSQSYRRSMNYYLGDYYMYFADELVPEETPYSQASRFNSFYKMNVILKEKISKCSAHIPNSGQMTPEQSQQLMDCKHKSMNPFENEKWLKSNDEMAFLFIGWFFVYNSLGRVNGELLVAPIKSFEYERAARETLVITCRWVEDTTDLRFPDMREAALRYCAKALR